MFYGSCIIPFSIPFYPTVIKISDFSKWEKEKQKIKHTELKWRKQQPTLLLHEGASQPSHIPPRSPGPSHAGSGCEMSALTLVMKPWGLPRLVAGQFKFPPCPVSLCPASCPLEGSLLSVLVQCLQAQQLWSCPRQLHESLWVLSDSVEHCRWPV